MALAVLRLLSAMHKLQAQEPPSPSLLIDVLLQLGSVLLSKGEHDKADTHLREAFGRQLLAGGEADVGLLPCLLPLSQCGVALSQHDEALQHAEHALSLSRTLLLPAGHSTVARCLTALASVCQARGRHERAAGLLREAYERAQLGLPPSHPSIADSLFNLVQVTADADAASQMLQQASDTWRRVLEPDDPRLAKSLGSAARRLSAAKQHDKARAMAEEALAVALRAYPPAHPGVAAQLAELADVVAEAGDSDEAAGLYDESLDIHRQAYGPRHPEVARVLFRVAALCEARGDYARSLVVNEEMLAIAEATMADGHPDRARQAFRVHMLRSMLGLPSAAAGGEDGEKQEEDEEEEMLRRAIELSLQEVASHSRLLPLRQLFCGTKSRRFMSACTGWFRRRGGGRRCQCRAWKGGRRR